MSEYPAYYAYPSAPPVYKPLPNPVRLHWGWVLALELVTRGLFGVAWLIVMANWSRRVHGKSTAFIWSIVYAAMFPLLFLIVFSAGIVMAFVPKMSDSGGIMLPVLGGLLLLGSIVVRLVAVFLLKGELEAAPISIPLGAVMTFFFASIYFQYHLFDFTWPDDAGTRINEPVPTNVEPVPVIGFHGETMPSPDAPES